MIARSDLVILAISGTLLATGIYRWQSNLQPTIKPVASTPARQPLNADRAIPANASISKPAVSTATPSPPGTEATASTENPGGTTDNGSSTPTGPATSTVSGTANGLNNSTAAGSTTPGDASLYGSYIVQPGDNLTYIANLHGTSVETLRTINNIEGSLIYVDQELLYPLPAN